MQTRPRRTHTRTGVRAGTSTTAVNWTASFVDDNGWFDPAAMY